VEVKVYILKLGKFIALPFILIAAVVMVSVHVFLTFLFSIITIYHLLCDIYSNKEVTSVQP
jgi:hypothetical protein